LYLSLERKSVFAEVVDQLSFDIPWDLGNPNVRRLMNDLASNVAGINETTRQDVQRTVVDALDEGVPLSQLQERLTGLFEDTYRGRAMTVAVVNRRSRTTERMFWAMRNRARSPTWNCSTTGAHRGLRRQ
jgi:hypothetical protein